MEVKSSNNIYYQLPIVNYRKKSTTYEVGDIVYILHNNQLKKLVCVKAGTTSNDTLTLLNTNEGTLNTDGTAIFAVDSFADGCYSAGHHNGIFRHANITEYMNSGLMSTNITAGKYVNMYIGDYVVKTITIDENNYEREWLIAHFKYFYGANISNHHIILIPSTSCGTALMNNTSTTEGGYVGSTMWTVTIPKYVIAIKNTFGNDHVLKHKEFLSDAVDLTAPSAIGGNQIGSATHWISTDVYINIPSNIQISGNNMNVSSTWSSSDIQFALYRLQPNYATTSDILLRDVATKNTYGVIWKIPMYNAIITANYANFLTNYPNSILPYFCYI